MIFPVRPTCHDKDYYAQRFGEVHWQTRDDGMRHCSFCGCIHPEDLMNFVKSNPDPRSKAYLADPKYGWYHKYYIDLYHGDTPIYLKFYNEHLIDEGYDEEAINTTLAFLTDIGPIKWVKDEKGTYCVPKTEAMHKLDSGTVS